MTVIEFDCDRCKRRVTGIHSQSATGGFYVVSEGKAFEKYGRPDEHFVCDDCIQSDPEYRRDYGLAPA
jgi:hypothetical protein